MKNKTINKRIVEFIFRSLIFIIFDVEVARN